MIMFVLCVLVTKKSMEIKMLFVYHVLIISLLTRAIDVSAQDSDKEHQGAQTCGGRLKGPVGIIQTPNFPNPFPVPIKCRWIIEHDIVNGTISVYFTQQFTTSGLTFTEYTYYDESYKLEERRALTVTEENITKIKWLKAQSPVLVVELNLNRLEGTQLRALGLLSMFGFNMTYAVRGPNDPPGPSSCSAIECRLLGHCYARQDYQQFYCSCFEGYSGVDCGMGSLCLRTSNMCKNGGTCRQMGPAAISCICAPGYTGDLCEAQLTQLECGPEECSEGCNAGTSCDCSTKDTDFTSARYDTRLQVVDQPKVNISGEIINELTRYLKASNITLEDEIQILNISAVEDSGARSVWVRVWSTRRLAGALRAALARLAATRATSTTLRLLPDTLYFEMHPALSLNALMVNQRPEVWEGSEFILSCMANGSPDIVFTWYKDGVKVNFNGTTRDIWTRLVSEDALGRRMSVLGVSSAQQIDGGAWSCAADDAGRRRCRALTITVLSAPTVRLLPSALTITKGENVSITCLAGAGRAHGVLGFSWAREKSLLPMQPERHVWEDLYPAGSVLKLYNVLKSSEYRCQVTSVAGTNSAGVTIWMLGANDEACQGEVTHGIRWFRTAPGAHASASCPPGYSGEITRFCEPKIGHHGVKWKLPDFSVCVADTLKDIYDQFTLISYGYSWGNVSDVSRQYLSLLRYLPLYSGAGVTPLKHATDMLQYLLSDVAKPADKKQSASHLLYIFDHLLTQPDSFLDEQKIYDLQNAIAVTASLSSMVMKRWNSFTLTTETIMTGNNAHFEIRHVESGAEWLLASVGVELLASDQPNADIVIIQYHNLGDRLPSLRTAIEFVAGREVQYKVCSQQIQVFVSGSTFDNTLQNVVTLVFKHFRNYSFDALKIACGLRSMEVPGIWSMSVCDVRVSSISRTTCRCRGVGTIALLIRASHTSMDAEKELRGVVVVSVSVGGALCLCVCALQLLSLALIAIRNQDDMLPILLRAATAAGHAAAMFTLLHCEDQETACPGMRGWVLAACWCASCAALCAQPLLLYVELAGKGQRRHSVGLLAGVCVLTCLCARLWGGAPLQPHSEAGAVYFGGVALLSVLTLALALCARRMLRHVKQKIPPNRRAYIKNRKNEVYSTLVLLITTSAVQIAGVTYVQPGEHQQVHAAALSAAALTNGVAMLVYYVIRDEECLRAARHVLSPSDDRDWEDSRAGNSSLSLYLKEPGNAKSHVGLVDTIESCLSPVVSPAVSYWRAHAIDSPTHGRQTNPVSRADIVRCVELQNSITHERECVQAPICDLIPLHATRQYCVGDTACLELSKQEEFPSVLLNGYLKSCIQSQVDIAQETSTICAQSSPDKSLITSPPMSNCLKKNSREFPSSTSRPSIYIIKEDVNKSCIEHVNRKRSKAYDSSQTDKLLHKISHDLDFLLNRSDSNHPSSHIDEEPSQHEDLHIKK